MLPSPSGSFADRLGVPFEPVVYPNPQKYEESFGKGEWDIAIGARVLVPAENADVSPDVWLIDLLYLAAIGHEFAGVDQVDRPGVKVGVIQNSPSDRYLSRALKSAELVRLPLSSNFPTDAIEMLRSGKADVFGADSGLIDAIAGGYPGAKIVAGAFHTVRVAVALPKGRSSAAQPRSQRQSARRNEPGSFKRHLNRRTSRAGFALRRIDRYGRCDDIERAACTLLIGGGHGHAVTAPTANRRGQQPCRT